MASILKRVLCISFLVLSFCVLSTGTSSGTIGHMQGAASWYAEFSPGIRQTTANMEIFDHDAMTCAIWDFPFGTILEVTNLDNGKTVKVRVNDRGPAKKLCRQGRVIDLTMASFEKIANLDEGLVNVEVRIVS